MSILQNEGGVQVDALDACGLLFDGGVGVGLAEGVILLAGALALVPAKGAFQHALAFVEEVVGRALQAELAVADFALGGALHAEHQVGIEVLLRVTLRVGWQAF